MRVVLQVVAVLAVVSVGIAPKIPNTLVGGNVGFIRDVFNAYVHEPWTHEAEKRQQQENFDHQMAQQKEFAKMGIQWRAEDARAAGLHPLSVLGVQPAQSSPIGIGTGTDYSFASQMAPAVYRMMSGRERDLHNANIATMRAQAEKDEAIAAYYNSEAARAGQNGNVGTGPVQTGLVKTKPDEVISPKSGGHVTAGTHAGFTEYVITDTGLKIQLPQSNEGPGESLENISWWQWPAIIAHNRREYGDEWGTRFQKEFLGMGDGKYAPKYRSRDSRASPRYRGENDQHSIPGFDNPYP